MGDCAFEKPPSMLQPRQDLMASGSFRFPFLTSRGAKASWMLVPSKIEIFLLSTSGKRTSRKCGHCSKRFWQPCMFQGDRKILYSPCRIDSNDIVVLGIQWCNFEVNLHSPFFNISTVHCREESLLGVPSMFSNFTREGSTIVMSDPWVQLDHMSWFDGQNCLSPSLEWLEVALQKNQLLHWLNE